MNNFLTPSTSERSCNQNGYPTEESDVTGKRTNDMMDQEKPNEIIVSIDKQFPNSSLKQTTQNDQNEQNRFALVPLPQKKQKKRIRKEKMKKKEFKIQLIMKNSQLTKQQMLSGIPEYIFRAIPSKKIFFLAGDIFVEIEEEKDQEIFNSVIFNEFRNILSVTQNESSMSFKLETVKPMKQLNQVIYELENSQNQQNYSFAQIMRKHQSTIFVIQNLIQQVIDSYSQDPDNLQILLKEREAFMISEREKRLAKLVADDVFACIGSLTLSFVNKTTSISHMSVTYPSVAMIGGQDDLLVEHFLRKGFVNLFNYASRRILFEVNMKQQQMESDSINAMKDFQDMIFEIPEFEICTLDNLHVICSCSMSSQHIQYPPHLQFTRSDVGGLNTIESFLLIRYNITPQHIETLLKLRQEKLTSSESFTFEDTLEVCNLEYDIKCQIIMEKFYKEQYKQFTKEKYEKMMKEKMQATESNKVPCKYRMI